MTCFSVRALKRKMTQKLSTSPSTQTATETMTTLQTATSSSSLTLQVEPEVEKVDSKSLQPDLPPQQAQLLLHAPKEPFKLSQDAPVPELRTNTEALIQIQTISLNPVDWKGPAFNFGLPSLPCVLGRDLAGVVVKAPAHKSRLKVGDTVCAISTDYRDYRKAAFQQYAVASDFNSFRVPSHIKREEASASGVAFVTAALTLGVCLGMTLEKTKSLVQGPDLLNIVRSLGRSSVPEDIRTECFDSLHDSERIQAGDWLVIWGASTTVGFFVLQLAKLAGLRVVCIADAIKHGERLIASGADVLVHRNNHDEAIQIARSVTGNQARYGIDAVGKDTAGLLQSILTGDDRLAQPRSHLVGLTGGPKEPSQRVQQHKVPIKLFHESRVLGEAVVCWMEELLLSHKLQLPKVDVSDVRGLDGVNSGLDKLRTGSFTGQRIVVNL